MKNLVQIQLHDPGDLHYPPGIEAPEVFDHVLEVVLQRFVHCDKFSGNLPSAKERILGEFLEIKQTSG
ncbi:deoxyribonuclease, TatD family [Methylocaldum marinum]|uniref:Deoxyribonuclease, TatD family n=1 Tax=Methylocaldum marinum TaxID=1432792 RepID=A0A250KPS2_9GAMM|nr:hypothetical protein [Methylocaldum marinum]BBA33577.1 deoxyribonuclease, TatD family [Methylocaldum marinum]